MSQVIQQNAKYWEGLAAHRPGEPVEVLRATGNAVSPAEIEAMGGVKGRRILQVAASTGDEAVTLAVAGAIVTAIDIAPTHIRTARVKAEALGVEVAFLVGDMTSLPDNLRYFDVVYVSWGGICWVPDLDTWVADMAGRLVPGGRLVVAEHHPLWEVLTVTGPELLTVTASYFDHAWRGARDIAKEPEVVAELGLATPPHTSYVWNLGQVVTAMLRAGLVLTTLNEGGHVDMYAGLGASEHLPSTYLAAAERPTV